MSNKRFIPKNPNLLNKNKWRLSLKEFPNVQFFCTASNVPGISIPDIEVNNPFNREVVPGKKLNYENFNVTFEVDEDLANWKELWNWMHGIAAPYSFQQHKYFRENNNPIGKKTYNVFTDGTLIPLNNVERKNFSIIFVSLLPIQLSGIDFNHRANEPELATVSFRYLNYYFE